MTREKKTPAKKTKSPRRRWWLRLFLLFLLLLMAGAAVLAVWLAQLDAEVRRKFAGQRWQVPATVYARPLELYPGLKLSRDDLVAELRRLGYRRVGAVSAPGQFREQDGRVEFMTRPFQFWDSRETGTPVRVRFRSNSVAALTHLTTKNPVPLLRLDAQLIGGIYPVQGEDRILVNLNSVPEQLYKSLVAVEDQKFYQHNGIQYEAIMRAMMANIKAGRFVQGGSTITQQLIKNFFLTNERTLWRKLNEAPMAMLLERHYSKDDILEAYLNEIYLGQDGDRAIHGFGLASYFYFGKPLTDLALSEIALLVGLVKGPSYYNPRRFPDRALERRNLVLKILERDHLIDAPTATAARTAPLGVTAKPGRQNPYPAFLDLVRRQLRSSYRDEDLKNEGLRIYTTLDPAAQAAAEAAVAERLDKIERQNAIDTNSLQAAVVVTSTLDGSVLALVGARESNYAGFNRALDSARPIGSLVKPAVYLTALQPPSRFGLSSLVNDSPLVVKVGNESWIPKNYDDEYRGDVLLINALTHSYNIPAVRVGRVMGLPAVINTLQKLGLEKAPPAYPSLLLGALNLPPIDVAQMYQTFAAGGFHTKLNAISAVLTSAGQPLNRYPLKMKAAVDSRATYLVNYAMQNVVDNGTARGVRRYLPSEIKIAGKTGTTNELRDSWFAGFTADKLAVVWAGRDDNQTSQLTGSRGALQIWGDMMARLKPQSLQLTPPPGVVVLDVDPSSGLLANERCVTSVKLPFLQGGEPLEDAPCAKEQRAPEPEYDPFRWLDWRDSSQNSPPPQQQPRRQRQQPQRQPYDRREERRGPRR